MPTQPPFKPGDAFNTRLDPLQEAMFRQWLSTSGAHFNPDAMVSDYDMRGYWQGLQRGQPMARPPEMNPNDHTLHVTDYYKTPFHQSFSQESQWGTPQDPSWINDHQLAYDNGKVAMDETAPPSQLDQLLQMLKTK